MHDALQEAVRLRREAQESRERLALQRVLLAEVIANSRNRAEKLRREFAEIPAGSEIEVSRRRFEEQLRDAIIRIETLPVGDQLRAAVERATTTPSE